MSRRKLEDRNIRKLIKSTTSYHITIPIEIIRELGWKKGQKLIVEARGKGISVRDWK